MKINSKRGRLKIYLGMSAGVGKTYAMLKDAEEELQTGIDIVAGYIEPHGRKDTENLINHFEIIPTKEISHEGIVLKEFDLESSLKRAPKIILVDELAHTNAPGSLHNKRWLDIQTLLDAGISVYSTLNIQHLESISELVSSLCGISVHETIPDSVLREADSIEVIDIPPEELISRLKAGKIYRGDKIDSALRNFFKEGTLLALREILLRKAAEKIDRDVIKFRESLAVSESWATSDRMIVAVGPNRFAKRLIQKAARIASTRKSALIALYVQTPDSGMLSQHDQLLIDDALQTAQGFGASIERRFGTDIVSEILKVSIDSNASLILVGKPIKNKLRDFILGSLADDLVRRSGNIDVLLVTGEIDDATMRPLINRHRKPKIISLFYALFIVALCTSFGLFIESYVEVATIAMLYILGAVVLARGASRTESVVASIVSILCFNFFFIEPKFTFTINNPEYFITFIVMLAVSLSISSLVTRIRLQNQVVENRERRTLALYEAGRNINVATTESQIFYAAQQSICHLGQIDCGIFIANERTLKSAVKSKSFFEIEPEEFAVAKFVMDKRASAGMTTDILPGASGLYLPIQSERELFGICAVQPIEDHLDRELIPTIELILQQAALSLERLRLEKQALSSQVQIETESMRALVLSSVSHDFRTPLTVIEGAAEQIATNSSTNSKVTELVQLILEHSKRLTRVVNNALSFAKLEQGNPKLNLEWESIEELIGQALAKYRDKIKTRTIHVDYPEDLPLIEVDAVLIDQLITNVIENSIIHAPNATFLNVIVKFNSDYATISIIDDGPGLSPKDLSKMPKVDTEKHSGSGLGIPICDMIAKLHGGAFSLKTREDGKTIAELQLPIRRTNGSSKV